MKNTKIFLIAALLGTTLASCQKEASIKPSEDQPEAKAGWTLTVSATKDIDSKAMSWNGTELKAYWKEGEKVGVYFGDSKIGTLTAGSITNEGQNAVLSGTLDNIDGLSENSSITLLFPDKDEWSYLGQDGSAPSDISKLATDFDYATAKLTVSSLDTDTKKVTVSSAASFDNQQSVYRLGFKVSGAAVAVKSIFLTARENKLVVSRSFASGAWSSTRGTLSMEPSATPAGNLYFMAIRNENTSDDDSYTFTVVRSSDNAVLEGTKNIPADALKSPMYLPASVTVSQKVMSQSASEIQQAEDVL